MTPMTPTEAIAPNTLRAATEQLVACSAFPERLGWWLQHGHSSERWVQFEWAFRLQETISPAFAVLCEHRRLDVSVVPLSEGTSPLGDAEPVAGVELKWWGNWWVKKKAVRELADDLRKIDAHDFPAAAVLFVLVVDPKVNPAHAWIAEQIRCGDGISDVGPVREVFLPLLDRDWDFETQIDLPPAGTLEAASLYVFAFYNRRARVAPSDAAQIDPPISGTHVR